MEKKLGRPPKPADEQLATIVPVRMTTLERRQFQAAADLHGRTLSAWIRDKLLRAVKRGRKSA
jgi:hypothetical protein